MILYCFTNLQDYIFAIRLWNRIHNLTDKVIYALRFLRHKILLANMHSLIRCTFVDTVSPPPLSRAGSRVVGDTYIPMFLLENVLDFYVYPLGYLISTGLKSALL
jgi:hypothetical protein